MENREWLTRFLDDCKFRDCRPTTLQAYEQRLGVFLDYIDEMPVTDVKRPDCMAFLVSIGETLSPSSVGSYITTLKAFGRFVEADLWDEGWRNVFGTLRYPKTEDYIPVILTVSEVEAMIAAMPFRTATEKRDKALVSLAYSSGLRANELSNLHISDVNIHERTVHVRNGKGGKERWSFFDNATAEAISACINARDTFDSAESPYLFIGRGTDRLSRASVYNVVVAAGENIGVSATPHTLRRSRATHLRESGAPIDIVQLLLGHSSPTVTAQHYVKVDPGHIRDMVEGASNVTN